MAKCINCDSPADKKAKVCPNCGNSPWTISGSALAEVDKKLMEASNRKGGGIIVSLPVLTGILVLLFGVSIYQFEIIAPIGNTPEVSPANVDNQTVAADSVDGYGTSFSTTDPHLSVHSSSPLHMTFTAIGTPLEIRMMDIAVEELDGKAELEIDGLEKDFTYYLYRDEREGAEKIKAEDCVIRFSVVGSPQHVWIQNKPSTKYIGDDPTGRDCASIGTWDYATKTCTMTQDIDESVYMLNDSVVLDCDGHAIHGAGTGYAIYLSYRGNNETVRNCVLSTFSYGVYLYYANYTTVRNNDINDMVYGIYVRHGNYNKVFHDNFINAQYSATNVGGSNNLWDNSYPSGGNYWSDYAGSDSNGDNIGETSYDFSEGSDRYPFMQLSAWTLGRDSDGDGIGNLNDNCPATPNFGQEDMDNNGVGDVCEAALDDVPPTTQATLSGTEGNNGWYVSDVIVTLTAEDNEGGSGVSETQYSLDGGATWDRYENPFGIAGEGTTTIHYRSTDNAGNSEETKDATVRIDKTAPIINVLRTPQPNSFGWNNADVKVHFDCSDNPGSGVDYVTDDVTLTNEAAGQSVSGTCRDMAGNSATAIVSGISIDKTAPRVSIATPQQGKAYKKGMLLNYSASDAMSGVKSVGGYLNGTLNTSQNVPSGFAPAPDAYTLAVKAEDKAGNIAQSSRVNFVVYDALGSAAGGGWFAPDNESTMPGGRAVFGFAARYQKDIPAGTLEFLYSKAGINLKSRTIDWLVIANSTVQLQGTGTLNGKGLYTFRVIAKSAAEPRIKADSFDIKIWTGTDTNTQPKYRSKSTLPKGVIVILKK